MKAPFKRENADALAEKFGFDRVHIRAVLSEMQSLLQQHRRENWATTVDTWLQELAKCETLQDDKALAERILNAYGNLGITDVYFVDDDREVLVNESQRFRALLHELSAAGSRILTPWLYDPDVEEI